VPGAPKSGGGEIPHKPAGEGRSGSTCPVIRSRKVVKVAVGGKLHRRGGKTHFPGELYINTMA
jgi:hypothetical protein